MNRHSLLVAIVLFLHGCTAKPRSPWAKVGEDQYQETLQSEELSRKMSVGLKEEVEPPEDMAVTDDDVDPSMAIWKAVQWSKGRKHLVPEVDDDDLYHPAFDAAVEPGENAGPPGEASFRIPPPAQPYRQAEPDRDGEFHAFPGPEVQGAEPEPAQRRSEPVDYSQPEEDSDELYHREIPAQRSRPQALPALSKPLGRVSYTHPEEDLDHLYHN